MLSNRMMYKGMSRNRFITNIPIWLRGCPRLPSYFSVQTKQLHLLTPIASYDWLGGLHNICATSCVYIYIFLVTIIKIFVLYCIVLTSTNFEVWPFLCIESYLYSPNYHQKWNSNTIIWKIFSLSLLNNKWKIHFVFQLRNLQYKWLI